MSGWFDTGLKMADGKTKRTVYASDKIQAREFRKKGWKPVAKRSKKAKPDYLPVEGKKR